MKISLSFSQYRVNHFTAENGLPSNGIKGLQFDHATGFLWIATEARLKSNGLPGIKSHYHKGCPSIFRRKQ